MLESVTEYKVGQVVYIILDKKQQVFPVQIAEVIKKYTLEGEQVNYKIILPEKGMEKKFYDLEKLSNKVFENIEQVGEFLTERFQTQLNSIMEAATIKSYFFSGGEKSVTEEADEIVSGKVDAIEGDHEEENAQKQQSADEHLEDDAEYLRDSDGNIIGKVGNFSV